VLCVHVHGGQNQNLVFQVAVFVSLIESNNGQASEMFLHLVFMSIRAA